MAFELPRWWWNGFIIGLILLALGGALGAVERGMEDNLMTDGCGPRYGPLPADEQPEGVDCRSQNLWTGIVDGAARATFGPGIAIAILAGVYILGSAIASGATRRDGSADGGDAR